jgi:hypothetical protein
MGGACKMNGGGEHIGYWCESQWERRHNKDHDVGGWTILRWILQTGWGGIDWIG